MCIEIFHISKKDLSVPWANSSGEKVKGEQLCVGAYLETKRNSALHQRSAAKNLRRKEKSMPRTHTAVRERYNADFNGILMCSKTAQYPHGSRSPLDPFELASVVCRE